MCMNYLVLVNSMSRDLKQFDLDTYNSSALSNELLKGTLPWITLETLESEVLNNKKDVVATLTTVPYFNARRFYN